MKKIGQGFYYNVYDKGNGRVVKKLSSYFSRVIKLMGKIEDRGFWSVISPVRDRRSVLASINSSKDVLAKIGPELLGNPVFINKLEYEQDKAQILEDYIKSHTDEEVFEKVQIYVAFAILLWRYGYGDSVYNFTINAGVSEKTGQVISVDFNEFTQSKEKMEKEIASKKWLTQKSLRDFPKDRFVLKEMIKDLFDESFTVTELNRLWQARVAL